MKQIVPCLRGALRFSFLRFWLYFRSVFRFLCQKNFGFSVLVFERFADFPCLTFSFRFSRKILTGFLIWYSMPFSVFPVWPIWVPVSSRIYQGFHWDVKMYRFWQFCMRFSVFIEPFFGFSVLDDIFYGFSVSNRPQCPPPAYQSVILFVIWLHFDGRDISVQRCNQR